LEATKTMLAIGQLLEFLNKGLIVPIPKFGDRSLIGNWWPVTFLGSVYKVVTKLLTKHIQAHLPQMI
jgi:hypothetical protein